ncbi:hypothetical protein [Salinarchaeum laminariae]|uniref:hypothetical protein n=1 Tax=Salinarchaeum laminariae TaxID=869888 RepID=UPI0020C0842A|nr:hypothetical protein [Salinarchaeum laminariae]
MDAEEAANTYVLIFEYVDIPMEEASTLEFPAQDREASWTFAMNAHIKEERTVSDLPGRNSETTIHPNQILVFLGETHAGTLGMGHGEFYEEKFEESEDDLLEEMMSDFLAEFKN